MKNLILTLVCLFAAVTLRAQSAHEFKCATTENLEKQKDADPGLESRMLLYEEQVQQWISENSNKLNKAGTTITIPVVVHIVYKTAAQNISNQRVFDQIDSTNKAFAGQIEHSMGAFSSGLQANCNIQFCLAKKTPDGQATNGIERRQTTVDSFDVGGAVKWDISGGMDPWDPTKYLNIWVCNTYSYFSGYANYPGGGIGQEFGSIVRYGAFGPTDPTYYRGNGGTLTHELGHNLNLRHIWGDDGTSCDGTDYCDDTPNQAGYTRGVPTGVVTDNCSASSPGIMYMNFMDYSDDIVGANYTPDQATRMQANFASSNGVLLSLANSDACSAPSSCEIPTALKVISKSSRGAELGWTAMYGATGYNFRYRKVGASSWTSSTLTSNSKSIGGLKNNNSYEFQVQTVCSSGTSNYSLSTIFTLGSDTGDTGGNGGKGGKGGKGKNALLDIEQLSDSDDFLLFPNPAKDQVTIKCNLENVKNVEIKLIDITGQTLISKLFTTKQEENNYTLHLNELSTGLYYIEFTTDGHERVVKKLIVE